MRVKFVSATGGYFTVDESRVDEYKAAGFKLAVEATQEPVKKAPKKKAAPKKKKEA